ncbi:MAG: Flp pilus assembly complex ATPase component TadA [Clostridium sp.]|nr:Flp pilus assembly complex ATPase component TadA [Acetatifactor muris]MCM1527610.1 Flp pilus assembly complex ATPase component TadA [Bacteroides sp.]MCM1563851.1 Flp pilus assembly complex ATPase component TadA [Clostridium sp.]
MGEDRENNDYVEQGLHRLVDDYLTQKQASLMQMRRGTLGREGFLQEAGEHLRLKGIADGESAERILKAFEQYIFGYSKLSPLIDDRSISDIRIISFDNIRVKREGRRMDAGISFADEREYRQFIDYIATKNQVNISNLNVIQRFTDSESHPDFILRFTLSMPLVNTYSEPYLCIRKVPRSFPQIRDLVQRQMMSEETAQLLVRRFRQGSTIICGGNSSGKTTLLNALKETLPDDMAVLVTQQADELTTLYHPDMMFLHSLPGSTESRVHYDLKHISIAGLTMDVDCFIIGEIKGEEALYLLNAACTGQLCAATIHASSADRAADKLVDYAMYESRYARDELMRMMDCFQTFVFMRQFRVEEIYACKGWNEQRRSLMYERIL